MAGCLPSARTCSLVAGDAYGAVVGNKHPGALSRSCREVLAEAWDFIGPRFDHGLYAGSAH
jgi:hypothetical protein